MRLDRLQGHHETSGHERPSGPRRASRRGRGLSPATASVGAFVVLLAAWLIWNGQDPRPANQVLGVIPSETVVLTAFDATEIDRLVFETDGIPRRVLIRKRSARTSQDSAPPPRLRERTEWLMAEPVTVRANGVLLDLLGRVLASLKPERQVALDDKNWNEYGLLEPSDRVEVVLRDGTRHVIWLGDPSPVSQPETPARYIRIDGVPGVYLLQPEVATLLTKEADFYRDREVLQLDRATLRWFYTATHAGRMLAVRAEHLDKQAQWLNALPTDVRQLAARAADDPPDPSLLRAIGEVWLVFTDDAVWPGDDRRLASIVSAWLGLRADQFVDTEPAPNLADYGLITPRLLGTFGLTGPDGQASHISVHLSTRRPTDHSYYGRRDDEPWLFTVDTASATAVTPGAFDWARTTLVPLQGLDLIQALREVDWRHRQQTTVLRRTQGGNWDRDGRPVSALNAEAWVLGLSSLRGQPLPLKEIANDPFLHRVAAGAQPPDGTLSLRWARGTESASLSFPMWTEVTGHIVMRLEPYAVYIRLDQSRVDELWIQALRQE